MVLETIVERENYIVSLSPDKKKTVILTLKGSQICAHNAEEYKRDLAETLDYKDIDTIIINLGSIQWMDSSGVKVLQDYDRQLGEKRIQFRLCNVNGLEHFLKSLRFNYSIIYDGLKEALNK